MLSNINKMLMFVNWGGVKFTLCIFARYLLKNVIQKNSKMKKVLALVVLFSSFVSAFCQDVIITRDEKKIEAKILEISDAEIKYKEQSNLEGPTFIMKTNKIVSILFSNGTVRNFTNGVGGEQNGFFNTDNNADGRKFELTEAGVKFGGKLITKDEMKDILRQGCPIAYHKYKSGKVKKVWGWTLMSLCSVSELFIAPAVGNSSNEGDVAIPIILGGICGGIGAPLLISGYHGKRDALELYNSNCANQSTGEFRLGVTPNGLGLSYNF